MIESFKRQAREWAKKVVTLNNTEVPHSQRAKKEALLKSANIIKKTVETVFSALDQLENTGLGFVQFAIPIAAIAAALAAMTKWTSDYLSLTTCKDTYNQLLSQGMSPSAANVAIEKMGCGKSGPIIDFKPLVIPALIGGGIWLYTQRGR